MSNSLFSLINSQILKRTVFFIPIFVVFQIILIKILFGIDNEIYQIATNEDGPIEYATFIIYFASFIFSLAISRCFKERKNFSILFLIAGIGFLFIAMEEISWGQRIFNWTIPDWFPENIQQETNIHNLEGVYQYRTFTYLAATLYGAFAGYVLHNIHISFFKNGGNNYKTFLRYAVPSKYLVSYFVPMLFFNLVWILTPLEFYIEGIRWGFFPSYDFESFELILSIGIFLFVLHSYIKIRKDGA